MIRTLILCWLLPLMLIAFCMLYFVSSMRSRQIENTVVSTMDRAVEICGIQLEQATAASKNASYVSTIRDCYENYQETGILPRNADITDFLNQQYKYDVNMLCTMLFFLDAPDKIYYTYNSYRENDGGSRGYDMVSFFKGNAQEAVMKEGEALDTGIKLFMVQGHLYMIRNLMDSTFIPYGMLVIELNPNTLFGSLNSVWGVGTYQVYVEGEPVMDTDLGIEVSQWDERFAKEMDKSAYTGKGEDGLAYRVTKWSKQQITYVVRMNSAGLMDDLYMIRYILVLFLAFMVPLIIIVFYFFHVKVTRPVGELVQAAENITGGEYGYQIESKVGSREFAYLNRTFNAMSLELKYQFERIYKEELELKDAKIMALQSQINPHFLNNTLEIINWEARMSGAENVSGMIEALGTMLSATMNRKQRRFVTLAEELSYVDAYLYIISRRFGSRFRVFRDIDESLLHLEVPILIIQPIVENAVEHGVEENKEGMVAIRISSDWDKIIIEVKNNGALSDKDRERIDFLLHGSKQDEDEHHVSLGIRNVNRRLKIIYGAECGLTIQSDEENHTVSRIVVKMQHESNNSQ